MKFREASSYTILEIPLEWLNIREICTFHYTRNIVDKRTLKLVFQKVILKQKEKGREWIEVSKGLKYLMKISLTN